MVVGKRRHGYFVRGGGRVPQVLLVPGRIFIREGLLWKVCRKGPKRRQFFLFNDVLVRGEGEEEGGGSQMIALPQSPSLPHEQIVGGLGTRLVR